jgi:pimeloyl-ACP methyl ester carboxylesterase
MMISPKARHILLLAALCATFFSGCRPQERVPFDAPSKIAIAPDGVAISYIDKGKGDLALVFVHGWSCDARYWQEQIAHFSKAYRVIAVDLAGHGHSGMTRTRYTMRSFAEDVQAVLIKEGVRKAVIVGHSMGGKVMVEAAKLMPDTVVGLVGVDTLHNVESLFPKAEFDRMLVAFRTDFVRETKTFIRSMFPKTSDQSLAAWVAEDMASASPIVAASAFEESIAPSVNGTAAKSYDDFPLPVYCINANVRPTDLSANRRHFKMFDAVVLDGVGHFLQLEDPVRFDHELQKAVDRIVSGR